MGALNTVISVLAHLQPADGERGSLPRDILPAAADVFARLPPPLPDDGGIRESVRAMRAADGLLLGVLDDDPTGSQAVHGVQAVTVLAEDAYQAALAERLTKLSGLDRAFFCNSGTEAWEAALKFAREYALQRLLYGWRRRIRRPA